MSLEEKIVSLTVAVDRLNNVMNRVNGAPATSAPATTPPDADATPAKKLHWVCDHCGAYKTEAEKPTVCECESPVFENYSSKKACTEATKKIKARNEAPAPDEAAQRKSVLSQATAAIKVVGQDAVRALIESVGGVPKMKEVPVEKLADLAAAITLAVDTKQNEGAGEGL